MSSVGNQRKENDRGADINKELNRFDEINKRLKRYGDAIEILQERSRQMDIVLNDIFSDLHWLKQDLEEPEAKLLQKRTASRPSREFAGNGIKRIRSQEIFI